MVKTKKKYFNSTEIFHIWQDVGNGIRANWKIKVGCTKLISDTSNNRGSEVNRKPIGWMTSANFSNTNFLVGCSWLQSTRKKSVADAGDPSTKKWEKTAISPKFLDVRAKKNTSVGKSFKFPSTKTGN